MTVKTSYHTLNKLPLVATNGDQFDFYISSNRFECQTNQTMEKQIHPNILLSCYQAHCNFWSFQYTVTIINFVCLFYFCTPDKAVLGTGSDEPQEYHSPSLIYYFLLITTLPCTVYIVQCTMYIRFKLTLDAVFCYWPFFSFFVFRLLRCAQAIILGSAINTKYASFSNDNVENNISIV